MVPCLNRERQMRNLTTLVAVSLTTAALLCSTAASAQQVHASGTGAGNWIWARATTTSGQRLCVAAKMAGEPNLPDQTL
jgi:hypothetical protein